MDRLTKLASNLYPRWWRDRYGDEFAALLEEARPGLGGTIDVLKGALAMQLTTFSSKRILLLGAAAGLLIGFATAFAFTPQYASHAFLSMRQSVRVSESALVNVDVVDSINQWSNEVLSRASLTTVILDMNLYPDDRAKMPVEEVLEKMRRNIRVSAAPAFVDGRVIPAFELTFVYPDPIMASKVVNTLASKYLDQNLREERATTLQILDPANVPSEPMFPNHRNMAVGGLLTGAVLGGMLGLLIFVRRLPPAPATPVESLWTPLRVFAACASLGAVVAAGSAYLPFTIHATSIVEIPQSHEPNFRTVIDEVLDSSVLKQQIQDMRLYSVDQKTEPMDAVAKRMREHLSIVPLPGQATRYSIDFVYPMERGFNQSGRRFGEAQRVNSAVTRAIIKAVPGSTVVTPTSTSRLAYSTFRFYAQFLTPALGLLLGAILGFRLFVRRRLQPQTA